MAWQNLGNGETPSSTGEKEINSGPLLRRLRQSFQGEISDALPRHGPKEASRKPHHARGKGRTSALGRQNPEVVNLDMNGWVYEGFNATDMGVTFDKLYYESDTYLWQTWKTDSPKGCSSKKTTAPFGWTSQRTGWTRASP